MLVAMHELEKKKKSAEADSMGTSHTTTLTEKNNQFRM